MFSRLIIDPPTPPAPPPHAQTTPPPPPPPSQKNMDAKMPAPPRKPLANKAHKKEEEGAQHPEEEEGGGGGGDDALPQLYLYHRAATADSWDIISGKQDVLSSIFRFLQLPELAAMYVSSSSSSLPPSNHPPTHPPSPHTGPGPPKSAWPWPRKKTCGKKQPCACGPAWWGQRRRTPLWYVRRPTDESPLLFLLLLLPLPLLIPTHPPTHLYRASNQRKCPSPSHPP